MSEPIPEIESARLSLAIASSDSDEAHRMVWKENWELAFFFINHGISHLESARAKIERHMKENE